VSAPPSSKLAKGASVLMLDGSVRGERRGGHMPIEEGLEAAGALRPERTVFTHIGHRVGTHAELEAWLNGRAEVAFDGMEIDF
jgi:phosphoribosyl 1,2-cyclic phosphate phosphodiesterase